MFGKVHYNDEDGIITGFYPYDIEYSTIPEPNIEITEEEHQLLINNQGKYIINNGIIADAPVIMPTIGELLAFTRQKRETALQSMADKYPAIRWESMTDEEKQQVKDLRTLWLNVTEQIKNGNAKTYNEILFPKEF
ncbi:MAG: hypothetical protein WCK67_11155 [bacterium]